MNNDDERDYAEEQANGRLLREEAEAEYDATGPHCYHHTHDEECEWGDCDDDDDCHHCECCCTCLGCEYGPRVVIPESERGEVLL